MRKLSRLCETIKGMVNQMSIRTYSELITIPTFIERYRYLKLGGSVGKETFGFDRYLNQTLYRSPEWKRFRRDMILRDNGMDLACDEYEIVGKVLVHHIDPLTIQDVIRRDPKIFDPENVVCVSMNTHKNDTCPWRHD